MKSTSPNHWRPYVLGLLAGLVVIAVYMMFRPTQPPMPKDYVLPHDSFDQHTMDQIWADLNQYQVAQTPQDHEVYVITGGLGVANPRIMAWGGDGNMDFGRNESPGTIFTFRQYGQSPGTWKQAIPIGKPDPTKTKKTTFRFKPVKWIKHETKSGQIYYKMDDPAQAPQYYFQEGHTYIWVMSFPNDVFPAGVMNHLEALGNPVKK